ncbi:MAG: STAS domain-containing protein [Pseudonocardiaceae bacterium]
MTSLPSRTGEILVLRVGGEVDLATLSVLEWALASSIAHQPTYLVVDLARLEFCSARGMSMLFGAGVTAGEQGFGYAISNLPPHLERIWEALWPDELPPRYRNAGTAIAAIGTRQAAD